VARPTDAERRHCHVGRIQTADPTTSAANNIITTPPSTWAPPYAYQDSVDSTISLPVIVDSCAGYGKVP